MQKPNIITEYFRHIGRRGGRSKSPAKLAHLARMRERWAARRAEKRTNNDTKGQAE